MTPNASYMLTLLELFCFRVPYTTGELALSVKNELVAIEVTTTLTHYVGNTKAVYDGITDKIYVFTETQGPSSGSWYIQSSSASDGNVSVVQENGGVARNLCIVEDGLGSFLIFGDFGSRFIYKFTPVNNTLERIGSLRFSAWGCVMVHQTLVLLISNYAGGYHEVVKLNPVTQEQKTLPRLYVNPTSSVLDLKAGKGMNPGEISVWYNDNGGNLYHVIYNYETGKTSPSEKSTVSSYGNLQYLPVVKDLWLVEAVDDGTAFLQTITATSEFYLWNVVNATKCGGCGYVYNKCENRIYIVGNGSPQKIWYVGLGRVPSLIPDKRGCPGYKDDPSPKPAWLYVILGLISGFVILRIILIIATGRNLLNMQ